MKVRAEVFLLHLAVVAIWDFLFFVFGSNKELLCTLLNHILFVLELPFLCGHGHYLH